MSSLNKDKIVLIAPGARRIQVGAVVHLPLSLLSLASWLREKGGYHGRVRILDTQIRKIMPSDFIDAAVVGISAMTGRQIKYGLQAAAIAKELNPDVVIVWGGVHSSLLPEQTAKHLLVDVVVIGEGEQTFLEVVDALFGHEDIVGVPGTCIRKDNGDVVFGPARPFLSMDELPLPAYDLVDIDDYQGIEYQFDYQSSRGCPFRCAFCYNKAFCGRRYRKKSPAKVVKELAYLYDKYNVINFGFVDDEFFIDKKRIEAIFDGILESGKFGIVASCRLDIVRTFSHRLMEKMKRAGVFQMFFGAESGSEKILKLIKKDISTEDIIEGARAVAEKGIRPNLSFMSGFPGETLTDFENTIDIILKLWKVHPLVTVNGIFPFNAYPGTDLYQKALELGLRSPVLLEDWGEWSFQYKPDNPWLDSVMKKWMEIAFYMVRFKYYIARYEDRHKGRAIATLLKVLTWPLSFSAKVRLKHRWFSLAWEWKAFAFLARKTFGYL